MSDQGEANGGGGRRANRLTLVEQTRAMAWLKDHRQEAVAQSQGKTAAALGEFLGRAVTVGNLDTLAGAAEVKLHGAASKGTERRIADLERRALRCESRLNVQEKDIGRLEAAVKTVADGLRRIAQPALPEPTQN
jgi:hypothetical protein